MQDFTNINFYAASFLLGAILVGILIVSIILSGIGKRLWAWTDDSEPAETNPLAEIILCKFLGYKLSSNSGCFRYRNSNGSISEGVTAIIFICFLLFITPFLVALIIDYLHIFACIAGFFALAFLTRAGRRGHKILKSHIEDKNLHNTE